MLLTFAMEMGIMYIATVAYPNDHVDYNPAGNGMTPT